MHLTTVHWLVTYQISVEGEWETNRFLPIQAPLQTVVNMAPAWVDTAEECLSECLLTDAQATGLAPGSRQPLRVQPDRSHVLRSRRLSHTRPGLASHWAGTTDSAPADNTPPVEVWNSHISLDCAFMVDGLVKHAVAWQLEYHRAKITLRHESALLAIQSGWSSLLRRWA
ncbi:unnamed protein product [Protopolystoma xenopodis]|uniref:Uncharacterized protein n=1 Tax=Protopolystoma xenopodis TaxID=117903 RepID=A0A448XSR2_9PLAT|nr:unnamed protein product [Protopolystoma xenopodis]